MTVRILTGDCRDILPTLPAESVQCCVTSPPYWNLRDYNVEGQIGLESTIDEYVDTLVAVFREVKRVLRDDGTLWLNLGDSYFGGGHGGGGSFAKDGIRTPMAGTDKNERPAWRVGRTGRCEGLKPKDLIGIPWMVAFALRADGWFLRSEIVWAKPNPMPESVRDRPSSAHEKLFLLAKSRHYLYDPEAVRTPMTASSVARLSQDVDNQVGSHRANGGAKTNGTMKAVGRVDKQRGHGRRHEGFNARWDSMSKEEQQDGGANLRNVWTIATRPFSEAHFATFPPALPETCIKAATRAGDVVLDPFGGSGTTGMVADRLGRDAILIELNPEYIGIGQRRIVGDSPMFATVEVA